MPEAPEPDDAPVAWARCIVRDMTAQGDILSKMTIDLAGSAKVASLVDEVAKQTKYPPDKFLISLQMCAGGEELILNDYLNHSLVEVGLETGGQSRNKLIITDAKPLRKQRPSRGLESGDHAGRTSPVVPPPAGAEGGSDSAPAYTYASGLIKRNETVTMLKKIPSNISPDLLHVLASMGHGDELVLADANFPTSATCRAGPREVRADGQTIPQLLQSLLQLLPLDSYVPKPVALMDLVPDDKAAGLKTPVWQTYRSLLADAEGAPVAIELVERFAFYERAKRAFAIVHTGERALYGNIILKKGVVKEGDAA